MKPRICSRLAGPFFAVACSLALTSSASAATMRVAVMNFVDSSPDSTQGWGAGLRAMITTDLALLGEFSVIERERISDIRDELKLQRSKLVDKKTAVRIGKLAGATHLVSGALTVVGKNMRLDCRLFAVETSKVLLASTVEGETEAFFELEKELVKRLVGGAGITLAPKDRAKLAKIHTADLAAFKSFSKGIYAFDQKKYTEAVTALRKARTLDTNFQLAQLTLDRYEKLIRSIEGRATAGREAAHQLEQFKGDKETKLIRSVIRKLLGRARAKGAQHGFSRLLAIHLLTDIYRGKGTQVQAFKDRSDAFDMARMVDHLSQSYWAKSHKFRGKLPAINVRPLGVKLPSAMSDFNRYWSDATKAAKQRSGPTLAGQQWAINRLPSDIAEYARNLQLDRRQAAAFFETLYKQDTGKPKHPCTMYLAGSKQGVSQCLHRWELGALINVAHEYRRAVVLHKSTSYFVQASNITKDPRKLDQIAKELKKNRDLSAAFRGASKKKRPLIRELAVLESLNGLNRIASTTVDSFEKRVRGKRRWPMPYLLVGSTPAWAMYGRTDLATNPRVDKYRASGFHYYDSRGSSALVITGSRTRTNFRADFVINQVAPKHRDKKTTANVKFMFGLKNLQTVIHVKGKGWQSRRPPKGYAVDLSGGRLRVVGVTGQRKGIRDKIVFTSKPIKAFKTSFSNKKALKMRVAVKGKSVTITVNGKRFRATLPRHPRGYVGFAFDGVGFAGINKLKL